MPHIVCPTCRKRVEYTDLKEIPQRPFCSERCKMVDLGRWLNEEYRVSEPLAGETELPDGVPSKQDGSQEG